jgi:type IV pilus assembly protein PilV
MIKIRNNSAAQSQRGFSLVEVLIALIIMSVGMLGIASLFVQSMQAGRTSMFRHHAVTLAGDVADRIRANTQAFGAYTAATGTDNSCVDGGVVCSNTEIAAQDILQFQDQAAATLPGGNVVITFNNVALPPEYTIRVNWNEPPGPQTYQIIIPVLGI